MRARTCKPDAILLNGESILTTHDYSRCASEFRNIQKSYGNYMQKNFLDDNFECICFHSTGTFSADTEENFNVSNIEQYLRYNSLHTMHTKYWDFHSNWNSEIV